MKLIEILRKMKVSDLKREISKQNIKGYSKLKKAEIIKIMIDRPDKFKYLLLDNMKQKKELLQDKIKLKEAKDKLKKLTAKKIPAKKAQKAEVIKPKPKREPMIPKIIKTKTGIITVKPKKEEPKKEAPKPAPKKEAPKPAPKKETKELSKDEKQLQQLFINDAKLKNKFKASKSPMISGLSPKERDTRSKIRIGIEKEIKENKFLLFDLEEKMKLKKEDDNIKSEKAKLKLFKLNVDNFLKNPSQKLLEFIDINIELMDELPESKQDKLDKAIDKFENKKKEPKPAPKGQQKQLSEDDLKKLGYTIIKKATPKPKPVPKPVPKPAPKPAPKPRLKKDDENEKYREKLLEANKKTKLFNRKSLEKQLNGKDSNRMDVIIDTKIRDKIELFSKTDIISDKDIDVFKKGSGKIKNRMFNIINDLEKLIFRKKTTKPAVNFINFLNNETNKREKLYIAVKIQQSFDEYCNKLEQLENFIKIVKPSAKNYLERVKFLDERCLDLIEIIDDLKDKFNITDKQIKDNELMIF